MLKLVLIAFMVSLKMFVPNVHAEVRDLDILLQNDREERLKRINEMSIHLNESLAVLNSVQRDLETAITKQKNTEGIKVTIRNASAAISAIGLVETILFQVKGSNPSRIVLAGGIGLSALAGIIAYLEHRSIVMTREEVENLQLSVKDLKQKIEIEKRNLAREIRLLCLEQGGAPEQCDQDFTFNNF